MKIISKVKADQDGCHTTPPLTTLANFILHGKKRNSETISAHSSEILTKVEIFYYQNNKVNREDTFLYFSIFYKYFILSEPLMLEPYFYYSL